MEQNINTIVILTALAIEQAAVLAALTDIFDYEHPDTKTIYKVGHYQSGSNKLQIVVGRTNQTNVNAAIETERVIQHFNPTYIFFLGVAGGLKDVAVGDIVVGTDVIGYERGKDKDQLLLRPQFGFSSYDLEQSVQSFIVSPEWDNIAKKIANLKFQENVKVLCGTIASGEKVVGSNRAQTYLFIKEHCSHALAVEMEGLGFLEACRPYPLIKSLIIRGISDLVEGKEQSDTEGSQPYASKNATEFLLGYIHYLKIQQTKAPMNPRQSLSEMATKLYPGGLRDNEIWRRAGGDLSLVNLNTTGKAQWIQALVLIEHGGGGDISFKSLVDVMKADYANNTSLQTLKV